MLTQVAGRTGRGESEGKVFIQTFVPGHYAIEASVSHNYVQFYKREIKSRRELSLPPFSHLITLTLKGYDSNKVERSAQDLAQKLRKRSSSSSVEIVGPAPAPISKVRGKYLWNILLKADNPFEPVKSLKQIAKDVKKYKGIALAVDVDPV